MKKILPYEIAYCLITGSRVKRDPSLLTFFLIKPRFLKDCIAPKKTLLPENSESVAVTVFCF